MTETERTSAEHLFVYGTLRLGAEHPLAELLSRSADYLGPAAARGKLFLIGNYPGMVNSEDPTDLVYGDLFRLHPGTPLLRQLDDYEECAPGYPEPTEYLRCLARVTNQQGIDYSAWFYLYNRPTEHLPRIDSGDFLAEHNRMLK